MNIIIQYYYSNNKQKRIHYSAITKYLITITNLLSLPPKTQKNEREEEEEKERERERERGIIRIERIEDIDFQWVFLAEKLWEVSHWTKVFHKMAQFSDETLVENEVEGFKVSIYIQNNHNNNNNNNRNN